MRQKLSRAMQCPDDLVIELVYEDAKGQKMRRVVSPIRFIGPDRFLALCLCREEPRQFYMSRCHGLELKNASDYVMPVPIAPAIVFQGQSNGNSQMMAAS